MTANPPHDVIGHLPRRVQVAIHAQAAGDQAARAAEQLGHAQAQACVALRAPGVALAAVASQHAAIFARAALEAAHCIGDRLDDAIRAAIPDDPVCEAFIAAIGSMHGAAMRCAKDAQAESAEAAASHADIARRTLEAFA